MQNTYQDPAQEVTAAIHDFIAGIEKEGRESDRREQHYFLKAIRYFREHDCEGGLVDLMYNKERRDTKRPAGSAADGERRVNLRMAAHRDGKIRSQVLHGGP